MPRILVCESREECGKIKNRTKYMRNRKEVIINRLFVIKLRGKS